MKKATEFKNASEEVRRSMTHFIKGQITEEEFKYILISDEFEESEAKKIITACRF
jgi:hypothetical protein